MGPGSPRGVMGNGPKSRRACRSGEEGGVKGIKGGGVHSYLPQTRSRAQGDLRPRDTKRVFLLQYFAMNDA